MRSLRSLAPVRPLDYRLARGNERLFRTAVFIALLAVIVEFAIPSILLTNLGIMYAQPGGTPLVKFHPGTYLVALAAFLTLFGARPAGSEFVRLFRATPALAMFCLLILACGIYSIANVGISGATVYVETYLSAGMLAIVLAHASDRQKRALAWIILSFCVLSVFLSIYEGATQTHLIPIPLYDNPTHDVLQNENSSDFRGSGLFAHPLTAALMSSMAVFLLLRMKINAVLKGVLFTILLIGLLSFGGRAALGMTVVLVLVATTVRLLVGLVRRDLPLDFVGAIAVGAMLLPPVLLAVIGSTDIGDRIFTHMYLDDSAKVRSIQWAILSHLNTHDVLFGVPMDRMEVLKYQIGLVGANVDIENFWLLMFLNLGVIGFMVFLLALGLLVAHLGRTTAHPLGWLLLLAAIFINSTSNSLGRKSMDLFMIVAYMAAMTGYDRMPYRAVAAVRRRTFTGPGQLPIRSANLAGMKS